MKRLENHPVLGPDDGEPVDLLVDSQVVAARSTDTVASALWADGRRVLRRSKAGQPRGLYCGIGHCFECRVLVDGAEVRACLTQVSAGMQVTTGDAL